MLPIMGTADISAHRRTLPTVYPGWAGTTEIAECFLLPHHNAGKATHNMFRGSGRLQRLIAETLAGNPDFMFSIEALARIAYPKARETTRGPPCRYSSRGRVKMLGWQSIRGS